MRTFLFSLTILLSFSSVAQPLGVGDRLPDFSIPRVNGDSPITRESLSGQVVIIDFWATWCGGCMEGVKKSQGLYETFKGDVVVVAVSEETPERIAQFVEKKGYTYPFGVDESQTLRALFPHRIIPHAVLVGPTGVVLAITKPQHITEEVIREALAGNPVGLPLKSDLLNFDYTQDYFQLDSTTEEIFTLQPSIPGISSFSLRHRGKFEGRRASMFNFPIDGLYRQAYQTTAYRMVYEVDESQFAYDAEGNKYCMDIVVPAGEQELLYTTMQTKLAESFSIQAKLDYRELEVARLYLLDSTAAPLLPEVEEYFGVQSAGGGYFKSEGATMADFASYLESFGVIGMVAVDETGDTGIYQFDFEFLPEDSESFFAAMEAMGLGIKRATREIEVLVIHDPAIH
ncbi:MAG TPA: hypothetical protein DCE41_11735 [Cytophagales bacterium]|nr:hypothetical protein [Cytophagales bacterium]HAA18254.1 hypothetical protein [Cytophagales bacterium]HAP61087.1 hypothetical protein [Cytophagales bacterium]